MSSGDTITQHHIHGEVEHVEAHPYLLELITPHHELRDSTVTRWDVQRRLARIGSLDLCDVSLSHPTVSRRHAQIQLDPLGYRVTDAESKNGVWVNQVRVRDAYLEDGDILKVGEVKLRFTLRRQHLSQFPLWRGDSFGQLYGASTPMRELFALLDRVARVETSVLIQGESGTGKELAARAIHDRSERATQPFIVFDCSATPSALIESELFGHMKGAFTGALEERKGAFASAEGGSLFLDEIGELPLDLQPKLLRALERQEVKRLGEDNYRSVNVRVLSATHRDLSEAVRAGRFRADLYYRLAVIQIDIPPLRDHLEDLPQLVERFIRSSSPTETREVSFKTMELMLRHHWPGNVRELKNYVQRALALSAPDEPKLDTRFLLPAEILAERTSAHREQATREDGLHISAEVDIQRPFKEIKSELIDRFERLYWRALLAAHHGNVSAASRVAGIHRKSAEYLLKKLNLRDLPHSDDP